MVLQGEDVWKRGGQGVAYLAVDEVLLIDLEPAGTDTSSQGCIVDWPIKHVRDGAGVGGLIPLDLYGVACVGCDGLNA